MPAPHPTTQFFTGWMPFLPPNQQRQSTEGSALSLLLFVIVMEAISREFRVALPCELLYADDLAVIAETEEELIKRLNEWKDNLESKGMRVAMNKSKLMITGKRQ